jgi:hydroxymethylpyrimidine pyrophosphatase-like HAD family hydrolase
LGARGGAAGSATPGPATAGRAVGDLAHIRLVATDLDGTLLRSDGSISTRTVEALDRLESLGIELVFITARPPRWMGPIAATAGHHGLAVCANGAVTFDLHAEQVVDSYPIPADVALEVVRRLRLAVPGGTFAVESAEGFGCEPGHLQHQWDEESNPRTADAARLLESPALKLLFGHPRWTADDLLTLARERVGDLVEPTHSNPERAAIELSALGVSKATTLARLCAARGIVAADVLAFGDMPNDLPMLEWAGTAVAVANAHPDVLAAVSLVTAANDEDGVALVIERLG